MSLAKIDQLLTERHRRFTPLQRLLGQAAEQRAWTAELRSILPVGMQSACQVRALRGCELIVVCLDSATATRLRLMAPSLAAKLQALPHFTGIERIKVKVTSE
ncbi:MAG: DciA family protein [Gammaproteobacteria bacterium]|nr:DciA family protein [Gammaproteobacteria bacterium]